MRPIRNEIALPEIHHTPSGDEYHIYYPPGKALRTVVIVYGMGLDGEEDRRLIKFARACTNTGLKVVIPHLPGLRNLIVAENDLQRLERILESLPDEKTGMALIGFSTGGSYALLLAANQTLKHKIGPLILFSPIYDAREVAVRLHAPVDTPHTPKEWDQFYWAQFVIAYRNRSLLAFNQRTLEALQNFLTNYDRIELEAKHRFYNDVIAPLHLIGREELYFEGPMLDQLSARGHLSTVNSPVIILHDAGDHVVPPDQSLRMHAELSRRGAGFRQEVLVTLWLSHVVLQKTGSPKELMQFVELISELFSNLPAALH
jgi:pimeloyl-ACP methyl ester carboxylesterase